MKIFLGFSALLLSSSLARAENPDHPEVEPIGDRILGLVGFDYKGEVHRIVNNAGCTAVNPTVVKERVGKHRKVVEVVESDPLPREFRDGVVRTFVRSLCRSQTGVRATMDKVATGVVPSKDALNLPHYWKMMSSYNQANLRPDDANLAKTYTLLLSLGMRESGGNMSQGADPNEKNPSAAAQAAGLFQASRSSDAANSPQNQVIVQYGAMLKSANGDRRTIDRLCFGDLFVRHRKKDGNTDPESPSVRALSAIIYKIPNVPARVPDPDTFRTLMKSCPAAATEYSAVLARVLANHNGPLIREKVVPNAQCFSMMEQITKKFEQNSVRFCRSFEDPLTNL